LLIKPSSYTYAGNQLQRFAGGLFEAELRRNTRKQRMTSKITRLVDPERFKAAAIDFRVVREDFPAVVRGKEARFFCIANHFSVPLRLYPAV
jgi:spore germination protein YaaH